MKKNPYKDHVRFFARELRSLGGAAFELSFPEIFAALTGETDPETDEVCREFATSLIWPKAISERLRFELCLRLESARNHFARLAESADEHEMEPETQTGAELLADVLIAF